MHADGGGQDDSVVSRGPVLPNQSFKATVMAHSRQDFASKERRHAWKRRMHGLRRHKPRTCPAAGSGDGAVDNCVSSKRLCRRRLSMLLLLPVLSMLTCLLPLWSWRPARDKLARQIYGYANKVGCQYDAQHV